MIAAHPQLGNAANRITADSRCMRQLLPNCNANRNSARFPSIFAIEAF